MIADEVEDGDGDEEDADDSDEEDGDRSDGTNFYRNFTSKSSTGRVVRTAGPTP